MTIYERFWRTAKREKVEAVVSFFPNTVKPWSADIGRRSFAYADSRAEAVRKAMAAYERSKK